MNTDPEPAADEERGRGEPRPEVLGENVDRAEHPVGHRLQVGAVLL
jgi:hypothetical protein